jgi:hypothetical protein
MYALVLLEESEHTFFISDVAEPDWVDSIVEMRILPLVFQSFPEDFPLKSIDFMKRSESRLTDRNA